MIELKQSKARTEKLVSVAKPSGLIEYKRYMYVSRSAHSTGRKCPSVLKFASSYSLLMKIQVKSDSSKPLNRFRLLYHRKIWNNFHDVTTLCTKCAKRRQLAKFNSCLFSACRVLPIIMPVYFPTYTTYRLSHQLTHLPSTIPT